MESFAPPLTSCGHDSENPTPASKPYQHAIIECDNRTVGRVRANARGRAYVVPQS